MSLEVLYELFDKFDKMKDRAERAEAEVDDLRAEVESLKSQRPGFAPSPNGRRPGVVDALWIAASGVAYAMSEGDRPNAVELAWYVARHPCDDLPYVADIHILRADDDDAGVRNISAGQAPSPAQFDGTPDVG